jgi:hypothetical protein
MPALLNECVQSHMDALFGKKRSDELRKIIAPLPTHEKEEVIIEALERAVNRLNQ